MYDVCTLLKVKAGMFDMIESTVLCHGVQTSILGDILTVIRDGHAFIIEVRERQVTHHHYLVINLQVRHQ
jgi:hypothetical protein